MTEYAYRRGEPYAGPRPDHAPYVMRWVEPIAAPKFDPDLCGTMKGWRQHD